MSKFKEQRRSAIEAGREKGDAGIAKGEERVMEMISVKREIDRMYFKDETDTASAAALERSYYRDAVDAHSREVEAVIDDARTDLEENRLEIMDERARVEDAIDRVGDMKGITDLAQREADATEKNYKYSAGTYRLMERATDKVEEEHKTRSDSILSRIENIFG